MGVDDCNRNENYEQLATDLAQLECLPTASEYHGLVCGRLAANRQYQDPAWLAQSLEFLGLEAPDDGAELKRVLALPELMSSSLQDADLSFQLWIAGDDYPLADRLAALADWCGGFLLGLAWGGLDQAGWDDLSSELAEALRDLVAISDVDEFAGGEEGDFMQLYEYTRMVALNVSAEVLLLGSASSGDDDGCEAQHAMGHLFGTGKTRH